MATANPHLRAILLAGALAAVAVLLGGYTLSKRTAGVETTEPVPAVTHHAAPTPAKAKAAAKPKAVVKPKAKAVAKPQAKPKAVAPAHAKPTPKVVAPAGPPPVVRAATAYGLPKTVAQQFATHEVVVVSVYSSEASVDVTAEAEAQAGAELAGVGFQPVDTAAEGASGLMTKLLGVVDSPAVLVFQRPDDASVQAFVTAADAEAAKPPSTRTAAATGPTPPTFPLFVQLQGFNDRETVAQAARNADPTPGGPVVQSPWAKQADALCAGASKELAAFGPLKKPSDLRRATPKYAAVGKGYLASLRALKAPSEHVDDVARFVALQERDVALTTKLMKATAAGDAATMATVAVEEGQVARQSSALATQLGAVGCSRGL